MTTLSDAPAVRERPILFSGDMVTAILEGRKTQTRRVVNPRLYVEETASDDIDSVVTRVIGHGDDDFGAKVMEYVRCPYGAVGDRLWVKETWQSLTFWRERHELADSWDEAPDPRRGRPVYRAGASWDDDGDTVDARGFRWRPAIHMPRWASRITLEITGVRVERLQDITEDDARAEGVEQGEGWIPTYSVADLESLTARGAYRGLWDSLNAARGHPWDANPWVWVLTFRRLEATV